MKDVAIWERLRAQFRLEAFDVFNNANFATTLQTTVQNTAGATNSLDSTAFGQLNSTFDTARGGWSDFAHCPIRRTHYFLATPWLHW